MGNKCFRPSLQNDSPVYKNSLEKAYSDAEIIYLQKKSKENNIVSTIKQNDNRKGNLKKLMDHLVSHKQNITPCLGECIKRISSFQKMPLIIVNSLFAQNLVGLLASSKKTKSLPNEQQSKRILRYSAQSKISFKSLKSDMQDFSNLLRQCEGSLFEMIYKILVYNNELQINIIISSSLITYATEYPQKFRDHKNVKNILELYLDHILQHNLEKVLKQSNKHFQAYECLLSKLNTESMDCNFVQNHLKYFLNIWCDLSDYKKSNQNIEFQENLKQIRVSLERIIQLYINTSESKCFQQTILKEMMYRYDIENFQQAKVQSIERLIQSSLNSLDQQYFMHKWLDYLLNYLGVKQSRYDQLEEIGNIHSYYEMKSLYKNIFKEENSIKALQTIKRWISKRMINLSKVLDYSSDKFFCALIINIYEKSKSQFVYEQALDILQSILNAHPDKCGKFICLVIRIIYSCKQQNKNLLQQLVLLTQTIKKINFDLTLQEKEIIFGQISKKQSFFKVSWLMQIASKFVQKLKIKDWRQNTDSQEDTKIICQYLAFNSRLRKKCETQNIIKFQLSYWTSLQHLCDSIAQQNEQILRHWLKNNQNILSSKEQQMKMKIYPSIEINMIIILKQIQKKMKKNSKTYIKLTELQDKTLIKMKKETKPTLQLNNQIYQEFKSYESLFQKYIASAKQEQISAWMKIQDEQEELEIKEQLNSVKLSDQIYHQSQDEDSQFKEVYNMLSKP